MARRTFRSANALGEQGKHSRWPGCCKGHCSALLEAWRPLSAAALSLGECEPFSAEALVFCAHTFGSTFKFRPSPSSHQPHYHPQYYWASASQTPALIFIASNPRRVLGVLNFPFSHFSRTSSTRKASLTPASLQELDTPSQHILFATLLLANSLRSFPVAMSGNRGWAGRGCSASFPPDG